MAILGDSSRSLTAMDQRALLTVETEEPGRVSDLLLRIWIEWIASRRPLCRLWNVTYLVHVCAVELFGGFLNNGVFLGVVGVFFGGDLEDGGDDAVVGVDEGSEVLLCDLGEEGLRAG